MDLLQKKRNSKIKITDIAIEKVPYIEYQGLTEEQNKIMQQLAKDVLFISKENNDCNEVAITCDIEGEEPLNTYGISYGNEYSVDVLADTVSNYLIASKRGLAVVLLHNHPSSKTFSLDDIDFFIRYYTIKILVVISNQGKVHFMQRKEEYYIASRKFLKNCVDVGIYYK